MTPFQRLVTWASDLLAHGPELGDSRTAEGSAILRDVRAGMQTVEYNGKQTAVPCVTLSGGYVASVRVNGDAAGLLVLQLATPIKPGDTATDEQCAAATPVLYVNIPDPASTFSIVAWLQKVNDRIHASRGPFVTTRTYEVGVDTAKEGTDHSVAWGAKVTPHDWPEDFKNGEGHYACTCRVCKVVFHGDKRRITCRKCAFGR